MTLYGASNEPWTFAELWRNKSLLCRSKGMHDEECSSDVNYEVTRLNDIKIVRSEYEMRKVYFLKKTSKKHFLETAQLLGFGFLGFSRMRRGHGVSP